MVSVWSKVQTCIWPSWCHYHSLSLAPVKSKLVLPFWYRLTWVVPEKGPLNECVCWPIFPESIQFTVVIRRGVKTLTISMKSLPPPLAVWLVFRRVTTCGYITIMLRKQLRRPTPPPMSTGQGTVLTGWEWRRASHSLHTAVYPPTRVTDRLRRLRYYRSMTRVT